MIVRRCSIAEHKHDQVGNNEDPTAGPHAEEHERTEDEQQSTGRQSERSDEDAAYQPVIIKRTDITLRHPDDTLEVAIKAGIEQAKRRLLSLLLSSIGAGGTLAFTALAVGVMSTAVAPLDSELAQRVLVALVYPLGFVVCLMSGTQLFTEHTALAVYPVLDRRLKARTLGRLWGTVLLGNLLGCVLGAALLAAAESVIGAAPGYASIAEKFVGHELSAILASAVLAGWLMALGGWLVLTTPAGPASVMLIYLVTLLIGLGGLHHSIAGSAELFVARFTGADLATGPAAAALGITIAGNLVGGSVFVAMLNYGSIRQTRRGETGDADQGENEAR